MSRLSPEEKRSLREASGFADEPSLRPDERFVQPTVEARERYIRFATQASRLYRGEKPVEFRGKHWRL